MNTSIKDAKQKSSCQGCSKILKLIALTFYRVL